MIAKTEFQSAALPAAERAAAYQDLVNGPGRMTPLAAPFHATFVAYAVGPMRFHDVQAVPHLFERTASKVAMDGLELLMVQHLVKGRAEITLEDRTVQAPEGSVFAVSFARPVVIREVGDVHLHLLTMSRRIGEEAFGDLSALHGVVLSPSRAAPYSAHFDQLLPELERLGKADVQDVVERTLDTLTRVFRVKRPAEAATPPPLARNRARAHIEQHLSSRDLTPDSIAQNQRMSRSQLYELFSADGGVAKYIWGRRLALVMAALRDLSDSRSLAELAYAHGFANQAHLSTLFRRTFGVTPTAVRQGRPRPVQGVPDA